MTRARSARPEQKAVEDIQVGQHDPMTAIAKQFSIERCEHRDFVDGAAGPPCTRAAGHSEIGGRGIAAHHPSLKHVSAPGRDSIAERAWH